MSTVNILEQHPGFCLSSGSFGPTLASLNMCSSSPVVLYICCLISNGGQVHFSLLPVRQTEQLLDHVVRHLLHELQGLNVVAPCGEDLVQPRQVHVKAALHAAHGAGHLGGHKRTGGVGMSGSAVLRLGL